MDAVPNSDEVARLLDRSLDSEVSANDINLQRQFGFDVLIPSYVGAFRKIRRYPGRMHILFWLCRYARTRPEIVDLARFALKDRSWIVRNYACQTLAYAQKKEAILDLRELLEHPDARTQADARAAIEAIKAGNHHLWADRDGKGNVFWDPGRIS